MKIFQACSVDIWCDDCPNDEYSPYCKLSNETVSIVNIQLGQIDNPMERGKKKMQSIKS